MLGEYQDKPLKTAFFKTNFLAYEVSNAWNILRNMFFEKPAYIKMPMKEIQAVVLDEIMIFRKKSILFPIFGLRHPSTLQCK